MLEGFVTFRVCRLLRAFAAATFIAPTAASAVVALAPQHAGEFGPGTGASATFLQISADWRGSTVLWNEDSRSHGSGTPIGSFDWGTGLWGRSDFDAVQQTYRANGCLGGGLINCWTGRVPTINFGNQAYNAAYGATWGAAEHLPGSIGAENWTAHFSGFIRIVDAGAYNFSVLHDDGFFFRLVGASGQSIEIGRDFLNPRERVGFAEDLALSQGLYSFELGVWNRLEAGVVDLRWMQPGSGQWAVVPTGHLLTVSAVPEPATAALAAIGIVLLRSASRRRTGG